MRPIRPVTALRVPSTIIFVPIPTGSTNSFPARGSRKTPEANPEAAALGGPGRMMTVGSRAARPSMKPLRV